MIQRKINISYQKVVTFCLLLLLLGCQSVQTTRTPNKESILFQQLGGRAVVRAVVERMVRRLHNDEKLSELFVDVNDQELTTNFTDFICVISQGNCEYHGAEMEDIHTELFISKAEFDRFVSLFIYSLEDEKVPFRAQNKLLAILASMRKEIIEL